jgi:2-iminobutanoate/2-iminopropanoate deaminase
MGFKPLSMAVVFATVCLALSLNPALAAENPGLPFSPAVKTQGLIFVSGQIGVNPADGKLETDFRSQVRRTLDNIRQVLTDNGAGMECVVKTTVFLTDIGDFQAMNEEYVQFFPSKKPARSTMAVSGLVRGALIEIEAVAVDTSFRVASVSSGGK